MRIVTLHAKPAVASWTGLVAGLVAAVVVGRTVSRAVAEAIDAGWQAPL